MLVIALPKGRSLEAAFQLLGRAGIRFKEDPASSRKLIFTSENERFQTILVKPADVPTYVEYGAADAGFAGRDVIMESRAEVLQPLDLNFGHCKLAIAAPRGAGDGLHSFSPTVRIATKYPHVTLDYFNSRGIPVEIIPLSGSIELAPRVGLADRIVDLVETGRTLQENGLEIVEVISDISARLIINRACYQTKRDEVLALIHSLEKVIS